MSLKKEKKRFLASLKLPLYFVGVLWVIKLFEVITSINLGYFGVLPRTIDGLIGILTYPLIHGDFLHLFNNSVPLIILGFITFYSYKSVAHKVLPFIWASSGILVWLFARQDYHIGASGVVYGLAFFIAFSGLFRKDLKSVALALFVVFWYGGIIWGLLPIQSGVSWEGHLFGAIAGLFCAYRYKGVDLPEKFEWNEEPEPDVIVEQPFWIKKEVPVVEEQPKLLEQEQKQIAQNHKLIVEQKMLRKKTGPTSNEPGRPKSLDVDSELEKMKKMLEQKQNNTKDPTDNL